jgi:hypothetical protein
MLRIWTEPKSRSPAPSPRFDHSIHVVRVVRTDSVMQKDW